MDFTRKTSNTALFPFTSHRLLALVSEKKAKKGGRIMTKNQIAYQEYLESMQHNRATENEASRSNQAREAETNRNNLIVEGISRDNLTELNRSNLAKEAQARNELKETKRANRARELENSTHNRNSEAETARGNDLNYAAKIKQLENDLVIARENNASKERINQIQADLTYWKTLQDNATKEHTAQVAANASVQSAAIGASGRVNAASIAASASKYNADLQRLSARESNLTREQIAEADRIARLNTAAADRALKAVQVENEYEIKTEANNLEKIKAEIDRKYKEGLITNKQYEILLQANKQQMDNIYKALDATTGPLRDLASLFKFNGSFNNSNVRRYQ